MCTRSFRFCLLNVPSESWNHWCIHFFTGANSSNKTIAERWLLTWLLPGLGNYMLYLKRLNLLEWSLQFRHCIKQFVLQYSFSSFVPWLLWGSIWMVISSGGSLFTSAPHKKLFRPTSPFLVLTLVIGFSCNNILVLPLKPFFSQCPQPLPVFVLQKPLDTTVRTK